jgi:hypothetical protein
VDNRREDRHGEHKDDNVSLSGFAKAGTGLKLNGWIICFLLDLRYECTF